MLLARLLARMCSVHPSHLAKLQDHVALIVICHKLEVLDTRLSHTAVEVQAVRVQLHAPIPHQRRAASANVAASLSWHSTPLTVRHHPNCQCPTDMYHALMPHRHAAKQLHAMLACVAGVSAAMRLEHAAHLIVPPWGLVAHNDQLIQPPVVLEPAARAHAATRVKHKPALAANYHTDPCFPALTPGLPHLFPSMLWCPPACSITAQLIKNRMP